MIEIRPLMLLQDNYAYVLVDTAHQSCVVVDPSEAAPVIDYLQQMQLTLQQIWLTHHHWDHTGGVELLRALMPNPVVVAGQLDAPYISGITHALADNAQLTFAEQCWEVWHVPGHTAGAVVYYSRDAEAILSGDTLFTGGCGRAMFHLEDLYQSLLRLRQLPAHTLLYGGHEYTAANLRFAHGLLPEHRNIAARYQYAQKHRQLVPESMAVEYATNVFLGAAHPELAKYFGVNEGLETFRALRTCKDRFK